MSYFIRVVLNTWGTPQDAEECANDLFVTVWQDIGSYDPARGSLRTWLTMRAKFIALDRRRHVQRRQALATTSLDATEYGGSREGDLASGRAAASPARDTRHGGLLPPREQRRELPPAPGA